jgi:hypothetical protein
LLLARISSVVLPVPILLASSISAPMQEAVGHGEPLIPGLRVLLSTDRARPGAWFLTYPAH